MLRKKTVFVIGAGAGVDIDMPVGQRLSGEIAKKVNFLFEEGTRVQNGSDDYIFSALKRIAARRKENAGTYWRAGRSISRGLDYKGSIDEYIHLHRDDEAIKACGKLAILRTILEYEHTSKLFRDEQKRDFRDREGVKRSWLGDFFNIIHEGVIAKETAGDMFNNLAIINFNYDRCIEQYLFVVLQELLLIDAAQAAQLMKKLRIFHPYGRVAPLDWEGQPKHVRYGADVRQTDIRFEELIGNIRTFNEEVEQSDELNQMRLALAFAHRIIFLGFHFHNQNVALITPEVQFTEDQKHAHHCYVTTYERSGPECHIIQKQIEAMVHPVTTHTSVNMESTDCKGMFKQYGTHLRS